METMPYQSHLEPTLPIAALQAPPAVTNNWRNGLPELTGSVVSLR